ncbi:MAG: cbb3-type cytochrome oxidase assembly protein, partial [Acidobacteriota bacterium]
PGVCSVVAPGQPGAALRDFCKASRFQGTSSGANMGETLTWVAIVASLAMGLAGACVFVWAVKRDYFKDIEDAKYQVFWSDLQETVDRLDEERHERRTPLT